MAQKVFFFLRQLNFIPKFYISRAIQLRVQHFLVSPLTTVVKVAGGDCLSGWLPGDETPAITGVTAGR